VFHAVVEDVPLDAVFEFEGEAVGLAHGGDFALDEGFGGALHLVEDLFPGVEALLGFMMDGSAHAIDGFEAHLLPLIRIAVGDGGGPGGEDDDALVGDFFADVGEPVDGGELGEGDGGGGLHGISDLRFAICNRPDRILGHT